MDGGNPAGKKGGLLLPVAILVVLELLLRQYALALWQSAPILVIAIVILTRYGARGWIWRIISVALVLSVLASELTGQPLLVMRLAAIPAAWLFWVIYDAVPLRRKK